MSLSNEQVGFVRLYDDALDVAIEVKISIGDGSGIPASAEEVRVKAHDVVERAISAIREPGAT
jgi:hypothetical protein